MEKAILHSDLNCFYASVEMMLNPMLRGKAVAVCGSTEDRHGIVLAKSEKAKKAGVKTGMVNWEARSICKDLIIVPPQYDQYLKYSKLTRAIYQRYTDLIEPFGMDECWLDVTGSRIMGDPMTIAESIRKTVREELGLTVSIGVSFNKIFAKLGSDYKKPDAITEFSKDNYKAEMLHFSEDLTKRFATIESHNYLKEDIDEICLDKYEIKKVLAKLMTKIDDLWDEFEDTDDRVKLRDIGKRSHKLLNKIKRMRKYGLERSGESDSFNIIYKVMRRMGYLDKIWELNSNLYDKINTIGIDENSIKNVLKNIKSIISEEVVADGNATHNPYKDKWKQERQILKDYLVNYGEIMTSKENGKLYKVIYDEFISGLLGVNYCICIQWDTLTMEPGNIIYVRAFDKFTRRMFKTQFDTRGYDNMAGTSDDVV